MLPLLPKHGFQRAPHEQGMFCLVPTQLLLLLLLWWWWWQGSTR
jgi:hypothetical protein